MRASILLVPVVVALACPMTRVFAQSEGAIAAYVSLVLSPGGAFAPSAPVTREEMGSRAFTMRYGRHSLNDGLDAFGARGEFAVGRGRLGVDAGVDTCEGCDPIVMLGTDWRVPLLDQGVRVGVRPAFGLGLSTESGSDMALAFSVGLPIGIPVRGESGPLLLPFLEPGFAVGWLTGDGGSSGSRATLGGGVLLASQSGKFGVTAGFQKVFIDQGEMTWGLGLTFGGGSR